MTSQASTGNQPSAPAIPGNFSPWADVVPKDVTAEDSLTSAERDRIWNELYRAANMSSANEKEKRALRMAVYVYGAVNGTSRDGDYHGQMVLAHGPVISAAIIARACSKFKIRKFYRSNMSEAYEALKTTRVMEKHPRFIANVAKRGVNPEDAFATADYFADCPEFTPSEERAHAVMFAFSTERARRAREGKALEAVEGDRTTAELAAGGPMTVADNGGSMRW